MTPTTIKGDTSQWDEWDWIEEREWNGSHGHMYVTIAPSRAKE